MFGVEKSLQSIQTTESEDTPWEGLYGKGKKKYWPSRNWCHTHKFTRFWRLSVLESLLGAFRAHY